MERRAEGEGKVELVVEISRRGFVKSTSNIP